MQRHRIQTLDDVAAISAGSYEHFMAHEHIYDALAEAASLYSERKALTYVQDPSLDAAAQTWTYGEFLKRLHQSANLFSALARGAEPRIAMLLPNIPEAHLTLWGGESVGVVCPINYMLDAEHIAELVRSAECNILVALGPNPELDIWSRVSTVFSKCPQLQHVLAVGGAPGHSDFMKAMRDLPNDVVVKRAPRDKNRQVALFHTGGTTGAPKMAQHTHGNQLHSAWSAAQMYAMDEKDVILNGFPLFHVAGAFVYGLSALLSGAELVLPTLVGLRNQQFMKKYWHFVEKHQVTLLAAVPTVISTLLTIDPAKASMASVRALLTGGSPLPNELASAFERQYKKPVRNILGMTESAGVVSIEPFLGERVPGSCGLALPFTEVVATREDGEPCAPGESGVVRLRGPNVSPGYTEEKRNTGTFENGWLISGDIGHVDERGYVHITGRAKDVIIRSGHNIDPQVIEEALLQHPDVLVAAAVGEPDEYAGELPVAFVSLREGATSTPAQLCEFANSRIPERPAYLKRIQVLQNIPLTAIGKVFKPRLRALACETAFTERLEKAGLDGSFDVVVNDTSRGLQVQFLGCEGSGDSNHLLVIQDFMRPFSHEYTIQTANETEARAA